MSIAVKETIDAVGIEALATASGIPIRTLYRWRKNDKLPGEGAKHDWLAEQFQAAVAKARKPLPRRKGKA